MAYPSRWVEWAGVVIRLDDGTIYAVEMDGIQSLITYELTREVDYSEEDVLGSPSPSDPGPGIETLDIHLRGKGMPWRFGAENAPAAAKALGGAVGELEAK